MRVALTNLGCKLNQAELEQLARSFAAAGHEVVGSVGEADLHVVNSCTVTHAAARDSRKIARRGRRLNPALRTVLTGCYVASDPVEAAGLAGVDLVVPNADKERLVERVHEAFPEEAPALGVAGPLPVPFVPLAFGNARALVKVEDGCNMRCAFCIIPTTRGRQRSRPVAEIVDEVQGLATAGFAEVVVTGVQISHYRSGGRDLAGLVAALLADTDVERLRLTSIAPWRFHDELLDLFAGGRLCRHIHMSLQSGCTATLERMRRPYDAAEYRALVDRVRDAVPGIAVTTDVIVGFPGETELEFEASLDFVAELGFAKVHAFPYSVRPGTAAAALPDQVPHDVRRARMRRLLAVAASSERAFWRSQLGREAPVLWEQRREDHWLGTSDNYIRVASEGPFDDEPTRRITPARLLAIAAGHVEARALATIGRT